MRLVVATRRSRLALAQSGAVARALRELGHHVELTEMVTTGDRWSASGAPAPGGEGSAKGMFVKELEEALLDGRADLAVHSAKDLPTELPPGLAVIAVPAREDPRDVLVGAPGGLAGLWPGARVGTTSPRRRAQIQAARPDLQVVDLRGNVDTRLRRLAEGRVDALVLAAAGLNRLGVTAPHATPLGEDVSVPAAGQGLLAIEGRADRADVAAALSALDDPVAGACLRAERAFLAGLGGGCLSPSGALCVHRGDGLHLIGYSAEAGGRVEVAGSLDEPEELGRRAAGMLRPAA